MIALPRRSLVALVAVVASALSWPGLLSAADKKRPSLVVVLSLDQFRADYLQRFRSHFGPAGFNLFLDKGSAFVDCHYRHSQTITGPGHAVMLSGVHANIHGIIGNDWTDRNTLLNVSCVGDADVEIIGGKGPAAKNPLSSTGKGRSPKNLLVTTVGDELKMARGGLPKVIGISNKDRSAILMAGHLADAAYFMEGGRFVSSTYYMPDVPAWVKAWNDAAKSEAYFSKVWDRVLPVEAYAVQGPDDMAGEFEGRGRTLPRAMNSGESKPGKAFASALDSSPFKSELLADFAKEAIRQENLGKRGITDVICVSFSTPDTIGHDYGPDSHEVMDNAVRTDRILADFFAFVDSWVGLENCTIVLTADHGAPPTPEHIQAFRRGIPTGRIQFNDIAKAAETALNQAFGPLPDNGRWMVNSSLIQPSALREKKISRSEIEKVVKQAALTVPFVQAVYTRTELEAGQYDEPLGRQAFLSFNRERSGDLMILTKPYYFQKDFGITHGSPYNYDTHVPLLWYGIGVKPGERTERVGVDDLAPTLSYILGIPAPPHSRGRILF